MHAGCPHVQSMSGIFSIASHSTLQYLPDVVTQEQIGCAHFLAFSELISILLILDHFAKALTSRLFDDFFHLADFLLNFPGNLLSDAVSF